MNKILITGCAGFIGSHLTDKLLAKGNIVIGIDNFDDFYSRSLKEKNLADSLLNSNFTFIEGNICNNNDLDKLPANIDIVIHLAAKPSVRYSILNPLDYIQNNIIGTQNILNWIVKNNINKLIFASSSSIYGNNKNIPFNESDNVDNPISPYAFSKKSCELLNYTYNHLYQIDIINLRFFTVYGPRQRPDLAIRKFTELISNNKPLTIFGDGNTGRDYTYIDDIIDGIISSMNFLKSNNNIYEIINLGNCSPVKLIDLVSALYDILNKTKNIKYMPMQDGEVDITCADITKAKALLNYSPKTSLTEGLKNFISWFEKNNWY